ncbi:dentin sialophosphoprotein-like isoform X3 [Apis laboriosa]|nr:dentin sialophosphoprotein-like isoform X3 [Apis laboriosa]XP_043795064.1 dentin sialophosphoprotein-like isoform X3 [Apis laboriosa]XP_043795065.1 dentin sialophosphoprotein-like isoform X3 [Apis laboriosa]XP_043795066.1 dentin sialophosphoprotein-like isoform X3 [Apis laboriosa]
MENERNSVATTSRKESEGITRWIESVIITVSQTSIGQALFKFIDSFLWVVEKSTQWSLPAHEIAAEENGKVFGRIELVRPLPWLLFLPGLVILRIIRCGLNVGAFILGYPRIRPSGMVKFVQKTRRRLRAINVKAVKARRRITCPKDKRLTMIEAKKALIRSIKLTLSTLSCLDTSKSSPSPPPMKIRVGQMDFDTIATPEEKSTTESVGSPVLHEMKRKFSQILDDESSDGSDNETFRTKLERLAMENSTDDSDFNIADCSMESSTGSSENDVDKEISFNETTEIQREAYKFLKDDTYQLMSLKLQIAKSMKDKETKDDGKLEGVDSSESAVEKASNMIKDFINGEINSTLQQSTVSEPSSEDIEEKKTSKETCDTEACTLPKSDSSSSKENSSEVCTSSKSRSSPSKGNSSECCASEVSTSPKTRSSPSKESPSKESPSKENPSKESPSKTQTQTETITLPKSRNSPSKESCSETPETITLPKSRNSPSKESRSETPEAITLPKSRNSPSKESCSETPEAITLPKSRNSPSKESCSEAITLPKSRNSPSKEYSSDTRASETVSALSRTRSSPSKESYSSVQGKSYYKSKKYGRNKPTWTEQ